MGDVRPGQIVPIGCERRMLSIRDCHEKLNSANHVLCALIKVASYGTYNPPDVGFTTTLKRLCAIMNSDLCYGDGM